ncbi:MAG: ISAzo13-like element transposase-related protein [Pseudonocardiaceae bacterium]
MSEEGLGEFFDFLAPHLDERQRRLVAGSMARLVGHGGIKTVAAASGMSRNTVIDGAKAFDASEAPLGRVRAEGGGRPMTEEIDPTLLSDLESLIEPGTRGDPMSALRWTLRSTRQLARSLVEMGHTVSHSLVAILLHELGYSLQATAKVTEGHQHPDRGGQFDHINALAAGRLGAGEPVISVDCKKKVRHEVARSERARRSEVRSMPVA